MSRRFALLVLAVALAPRLVLAGEQASNAPVTSSIAPVSSGSDARPPLARDLDAILERAWRDAAIAPAGDAPDGELCRRVWVDLAGRTPTADEARAFLDDKDPAKLERLVDRLLASPDHARHIAEQLTVAILGREWRRDGLDAEPFRAWLASRLAADAPLDSVVRELLTASGKAKNDPRVDFLLAADAPADMAGRAARLFLGRRIQCAQCHDHPYDPWKRTDFWAAAAFFQRVRRIGIQEPRTPEMRRKKQIPRTIDWEVKEEGSDDTRIPLQPGENGRPRLALPRFLGSTYDLALAQPGAKRMPALADEVVVRQRTELARALANRLFALLFGRGAVHPVDDFSQAHGRSIDGLLERLGQGLEDEGFKSRGFFRALALSRAYRRTSSGRGPIDGGSIGGGGERAEGELTPRNEDPALSVFARMRHKPLPPEVALRALVTATGADAAFGPDEKAKQGWEKRKHDMLRGLVALESRPDEEDPHAVRESIPRALALLNGPDVNDLCAVRKGSTSSRALEEKDGVELICLAAFARRPTDDERARWTAFLERDPKNKAGACQDLLWSLVNSTEFQYGH